MASLRGFVDLVDDRGTLRRCNDAPVDDDDDATVVDAAGRSES
jgi:hypothetical protein